MTFAALGLAAPLLQTLETLGYSTPTPVQEKTIPAVLAGRDAMAAAQTGTGKTAAFALPLLQKLAAMETPVGSNSTRALVLVPTRELAEQVHAAFREYGAGLSVSSYAAYGGVSLNPQMMRMRRGSAVLRLSPCSPQHSAVHHWKRANSPTKPIPGWLTSCTPCTRHSTSTSPCPTRSAIGGTQPAHNPVPRSDPMHELNEQHYLINKTYDEIRCGKRQF